MIFVPPLKGSEFPMNFHDPLSSLKSQYCLDLQHGRAGMKIHASYFPHVPRYKSFQESKMRLTAQGASITAAYMASGLDPGSLRYT